MAPATIRASWVMISRLDWALAGRIWPGQTGDVISCRLRACVCCEQLSEAFCGLVLTCGPSGRFAWGSKILIVEIVEPGGCSTETIQRIANNLLQCLLSQALTPRSRVVQTLLSLVQSEDAASCSLSGLDERCNTERYLLSYPNRICHDSHQMLSNSRLLRSIICNYCQFPVCH